MGLICLVDIPSVLLAEERRVCRPGGMTNRLVMPSVKLSTVDSQALPVAAWSSGLEWSTGGSYTSVQSLSIFHQQLKTFLFQFSFPIWVLLFFNFTFPVDLAVVFIQASLKILNNCQGHINVNWGSFLLFWLLIMAFTCQLKMHVKFACAVTIGLRRSAFSIKLGKMFTNLFAAAYFQNHLERLPTRWPSVLGIQYVVTYLELLTLPTRWISIMPTA